MTTPPDDAITVLVPCARQSFDYFLILAESLLARAMRPKALRFVVSVNHRDDLAVYQEASRRLPIDSAVVVPLDDLIARAPALDALCPGASARVRSAIHERCVRHLLNQVRTRWAIVADADAAMMKIGWDDYCLKQMTDSVFMVGASYGDDVYVQYTQTLGEEPRRAFKYQGAPNFICLFLDYERYRRLDVNMHLMEGFCNFPFMQDVQSALGPQNGFVVSNTLDDGLRAAMGLTSEVGLWVDVGADLPLKARRQGLGWRSWRLVRLSPELDGAARAGQKLVHAPEGYFDGDQLIAVHYKKHTVEPKDVALWRRFVTGVATRP